MPARNPLDPVTSAMVGIGWCVSEFVCVYCVHCACVAKRFVVHLIMIVIVTFQMKCCVVFVIL